MKKKEIIYLIITVALVVIVGLFLYSRSAAKNKNNGTTKVEVIDPIASSFDQAALQMLADPAKVTNFTPQINLDGLGNNQPFGPLP